MLAATILLVVPSVGSRLRGAETVDFMRDVRPILSNHCFKCHGPDEATREAGLRLDTPEGATEDRGGYQAIAPGDMEASDVVERLTTDDEGMRMPPVGSGLELSDDQIDVVRRWIEQGAAYEQHWSFRPIEQPAIPGAPAAEFSNDPIDRFISARHAERGLTASPEADRATLIRRVYLDLLGVLPSPDAVAQFADDDRPGAYERLVDRALANPHFGEKWGRHWLDQARYADTNGYTIDSARTMWPYRDWVIDAVNADMPFDRFTIEQLAGDQLPNPSIDQLVATGFHRNTLINQEGGTDAEQFRNEATVDRVNTTGAVWLGLTVGCAQCHTHKFDPLTHREYYQLFAFFNQAQDKNSTSPTIEVASPQQEQQIAALDRRIADAKAALAAYDRQQAEADPETNRNPNKEPEWHAVDAEVVSQAGASVKRLEDGSYVVGGTNADDDVYTISFPIPTSQVTGIRLETLTHPSLPKGGPGRAGNGNFVLNEVDLRLGDREAEWLHATADHSQSDYDVAFAIDGDLESGWAINGGKRLNVNRTAQFVCQPIDTEGETEATATLELVFGSKPPQYNIGRFRIAVTDASPRQLDVPDPARAPLVAALKKVQDERARFTKSIPKSMIMRDVSQPRTTHLLIRGDFLRQGEEVVATTPDFLPEMPARGGKATRLDLARWLVARDNPLTARVTVNRVWMRLFGRGLVETENDFGLQGTLPTHPALLDWLAAAFMENDWSIKHLVRMIVTSGTYRQASTVDAEALQRDPLNKWLARQSRVRVDAEIVRDLFNSASGLLDRRLGGASVYPPQPDGVYAFTQRNAGWPTSQGGDRYRRGMYTFFMRSAPHPMLTTFDAPAFNTTCTRRVRSNTPLQSLTMANDQAMLEAARGLADELLRQERLTAENGLRDRDAERIELAFLRCFSRSATAAELASLKRFVERQRASFLKDVDQAATLVGEAGGVAQQRPDAVADRAALTLLARVLMNVDEFITRE